MSATVTFTVKKPFTYGKHKNGRKRVFKQGDTWAPEGKRWDDKIMASDLVTRQMTPGAQMALPLGGDK